MQVSGQRPGRTSGPAARLSPGCGGNYGTVRGRRIGLLGQPGKPRVGRMRISGRMPRVWRAEFEPASLKLDVQEVAGVQDDSDLGRRTLLAWCDPPNCNQGVRARPWMQKRNSCVCGRSSAVAWLLSTPPAGMHLILGLLFVGLDQDAQQCPSRAGCQGGGSSGRMTVNGSRSALFFAMPPPREGNQVILPFTGANRNPAGQSWRGSGVEVALAPGGQVASRR